MKGREASVHLGGTPAVVAVALGLAMALGACKPAEKPPARVAGQGAVVAPAPPEEPAEKAPQGATPAEAEQPTAPAPVAEQESPTAPDATAEPVAPVDPERRMLSAYREIYCHQKKNDQRGVIAVWQQYGYDSASWAAEAQAAAKRAAEDPKGFGARWAQISAEPCP